MLSKVFKAEAQAAARQQERQKRWAGKQQFQGEDTVKMQQEQYSYKLLSFKEEEERRAAERERRQVILIVLLGAHAVRNATQCNATHVPGLSSGRHRQRHQALASRRSRRASTLAHCRRHAQ